MRNLAQKPLKAGADPVADAFYSRVMARYRRECLVEPTFADMKAVPAAVKFISDFKSPLGFREDRKTNQGHASEKAVFILDENRKELGVIRWIGGQGDPFFYHFLGKPEGVESILKSIEDAARAAPVMDAPAPPVVAPQSKPEYRIRITKARNGSVFMIRKDGSSLEDLINLLVDAVPGLDLWAARSRFLALKNISQASDFMAGFKSTHLNLELAVKVQNSQLKEAAIYVIDESNHTIAAMRYVEKEGPMFFQNFFDDKSQSVDAVLGSLKQAPAPGRSEPALFWMNL